MDSVEKIKIYVAGKFADAHKIRKIMNQFETRNCIITEDWTPNYDACMRHQEEKNTSEVDYDDIRRFRKNAEDDTKGVTNADLLFAMMDDEEYAYRGTWCEVGMAIALNIPVILYCPTDNSKQRLNVFFHHPNNKIVSTLMNGFACIEKFRLKKYNEKTNNTYDIESGLLSNGCSLA